ncbi:O-antigen ligase family protein [Roseococcus sp. DSY-14]|uniref:O-antigen ligase family protein n=1 Tax=Roseococcus sp. DSY-14 TaxID=3369650 RepID=UPI00387B5A66
MTATARVRLPPGVAPVPPPAAGLSFAQVGPRAQAALAACAAFLYSGAKLQFGAGFAAAELGAVDPVNRALQLLLLGGCGLLALRAGAPALRVLLRLWPFLLVLALVLASAAWSQSPGHTLRRSLALVALLACVASTGALLGVGRFFRILLGVVAALILASLAEAALRPAVGFDTGDYANAIRGVFPQKNVTGLAMLFAALALSFLVLERGRLRWTDGAWLAALLAMLVLTRSTTSLLLTAVVAGVTLLALWAARGGLWGAAAALATALGLVAAAVAFAGLGTQGFFDLIGKDSSLTGRTFIWDGVWRVIAGRPLLGHGYAAFWLGGAREVRALAELVAWEVPNAHSGYLEVLLQLGWAGLALVGLMALATVALALRAALRGQVALALWAVLVLAVVAVMNRTESVLLNPDFPLLFWLLALVALGGPAPRAPAPPLLPPRLAGARPWPVVTPGEA